MTTLAQKEEQRKVRAFKTGLKHRELGLPAKYPADPYYMEAYLPEDFPVRPLRPVQEAKDRATCGHCGLSWDDAIATSMTPAPAARCPFEAFHVYND